MAALEGATAWRKLHDPQATADMTAEGILHLMQTAGYSEHAAQKAATEWGFERVKRELPP